MLSRVTLLAYYSVQDLGGLDGQLRSLSGRCTLPSEELLRQVFSVGSGLTSLELYNTSKLLLLPLLRLRLRLRLRLLLHYVRWSK